MDRTDTAFAEYEPAFTGAADIAAWHMRAIACEAGNTYLGSREREKLRRHGLEDYRPAPASWQNAAVNAADPPKL